MNIQLQEKNIDTLNFDSGQSTLVLPVANSTGYVDLMGDFWFQVKDANSIPEFFTMPVSSSDHWMFVSSFGAVTAGRRNPDNALFPYYSCDKLIDTAQTAGPLTLIRLIDGSGKTVVWSPFSNDLIRTTPSRSVYKNVAGNKLLFEEFNRELGLSFWYQWAFGEDFGFIRSCQLINHNLEEISVSVLDGIQNVLPPGVTEEFQMKYSSLGDAYKKSELLPETALGLFYLSSIPSDEALPSEGLKATTVWATGLPNPQTLLSTDQLRAFIETGNVETETDKRGKRGAYLVASSFRLPSAESMRWNVVAELEQDHFDVVQLSQFLGESDPDSRCQSLAQDIAACQRRLDQIISSADGVQAGSDQRRVHRHRSDVTYNVMRGGIPNDNYIVSVKDFLKYLATRNVPAFQKFQKQIEQLGVEISLSRLHSEVKRIGDPDLSRLGEEYLPFTFGRRHGDPSRPWNRFSIETREADGNRRIAYEGNWRDIFQNWEAIAFAWPGFTNCMIRKFVNASTADGYNPYRINESGVDWEVPEEDQFSNIGYWGDHQIIYLAKLLEWSRKTNPQAADEMLSDENCSYVNVPYRIANYDSILKDSSNTIEFDDRLNNEINAKVESFGTDAKLHLGSDGNVQHVSMLEKLLLPAMVKMTNFVPGGGIWMNTQRPEWNDANNALVGRGVSAVTAFYLHRFFEGMKHWLADYVTRNPDRQFSISKPVWTMILGVAQTLRDANQSDPASNRERKLIVDKLSTLGSEYRESLYRDGVSQEKTIVHLSECTAAIEACLESLKSFTSQNKRSCGLYDAYHLLSITDDEVSLERLDEMLEGQVAAISSGALSSEECCDALDRLRESNLYRADQNSYILYPNRQLRPFMQKNQLDASAAKNSKLIERLLADKNRSVVRANLNGKLNFCGDFRNVHDLRKALDVLADSNPDYQSLVQSDREYLEELFESTFDHHRFLGRSGTFFAYEGLGSIYWHMVSKLALAVIEQYVAESQVAARPELLSRLRDHYRKIRDGLGVNKAPELYGAFPIDAYSHTPENSGAKQPGMTGQVKEDVLCRMLELGVRVENGAIAFEPSLFQSKEFSQRQSAFQFYGLAGNDREIKLDEGMFGWTWCQTPILFVESDRQRLVLTLANGEVQERQQLELSATEANQLFQRTGEIKQIEIFLARRNKQ